MFSHQSVARKYVCLHSDVDRHIQTMSHGHLDRRWHAVTVFIHISCCACAYVIWHDVTHMCIWQECLLTEHNIIIHNWDAIVSAVIFGLFSCFVQKNGLQCIQWEWQIATAVCPWHHLQRMSETKASDITDIHCHRVITQLQLINIIIIIVFPSLFYSEIITKLVVSHQYYTEV